MLYTFGLVTVDETWTVEEAKPVGFSRVYYVYDGDVTYSDSKTTLKLRKNHIYIFPFYNLYF